jgi:hypothetical protein
MADFIVLSSPARNIVKIILLLNIRLLTMVGIKPQNKSWIDAMVSLMLELNEMEERGVEFIQPGLKWKGEKERKWESGKVERWGSVMDTWRDQIGYFQQVWCTCLIARWVLIFHFFFKMYIYLSYFDWVCIFLFSLILSGQLLHSIFLNYFFNTKIHNF